MTCSGERYIPLFDSPEEFLDYLDETEVEFVVVDRGVWHWGEFLHRWFRYDNERGIAVEQLPPGWIEAFRDPNDPIDYVVIGRER